jgi:hypothetical protein
VDFYCQTDGGPFIVNVCYDLNDPQTRHREISGLVEALIFFDYPQGWLVTRDHEETVEQNGKKIMILPLWKWLLTSG